MKPKHMVTLIVVIHNIVIAANLLSVLLLLIYTPFYIWLPMLTLLVNPILGGKFCLMNQTENYYRKLAGLPTIKDRAEELLNRSK
jgi:hypothetical protein